LFFTKAKSSDKKTILRAVAGSSKMEGLSLPSARKNKKIIKYLKDHGRAFAI